MTESEKIAQARRAYRKKYNNREYCKRWRERNREKVREYQRRWRRENPDKVKAYAKKAKAWREAHPEKATEYQRNYFLRHFHELVDTKK